MQIIDFEASLVAALLEVAPAELGIPPVVPDSPLGHAVSALYEHDLLAAADAVAAMGKLTHEAYLRLRAGERLLAEGDGGHGKEQLERALAFYRGVRATRFVAEAEALLASAELRTA